MFARLYQEIFENFSGQYNLQQETPLLPVRFSNKKLRNDFQASPIPKIIQYVVLPILMMVD